MIRILEEGPLSSPVTAFEYGVEVKEVLSKKTGPKTKPFFKDGGTTGKWREDEHQRFLEAIEKFGNAWKEVSAYVGTRSPDQIRSHCQKHFERLVSKAVQSANNIERERKPVFAVIRMYRNRTYYSGIYTQATSLTETPETEELKKETVIKTTPDFWDNIRNDQKMEHNGYEDFQDNDEDVSLIALEKESYEIKKGLPLLEFDEFKMDAGLLEGNPEENIDSYKYTTGLLNKIKYDV